MEENCDIGFQIRTLSNLLKRKVFDVAPPPDNFETLTEMQAQIVNYLYNNRSKEICQRDIEENFFIRRSTASRFLKSMEKQGIITREQVPHDARLKKLVLTPKTIKIHEELRQKIKKIEAILKNGLTDEEICQFTIIAEKIKSNLIK